MKQLLAAIAMVSMTLSIPATARAAEGPLKQMIGCWVSERFAPTSLLASASDPGSASIIHEKMWLKVEPIAETDYLVFGYIYEWDDAGTYVLGPTYQNGAYNPAAGFLTFGFPEGGLDHVTQPDTGHLLYVHTKSADKSAMSVRSLKRLDCHEAAMLEKDLLKRQEGLKN